MLDISSKSTDPCAARLSNFTDRPFVFDGVQCAGLEGPIQAFKCQDPMMQEEICALRGKDAKRRGQDFRWQDSGLLWWKGRSYDRFSRDYSDLITRLYDAAYDQVTEYRTDLYCVTYVDIRHTMGNTDMRATVLTEVEMIHQLNRLRIREMHRRK